MSELRSLTGARGVAAWLVVLYHIRGSIAGLPGWAKRILAKGYLAVDFFFLLSGFVIWLAWNARLRRDGVAGVPGFLRRRIARIWPLHGVMLGFAVALAGLLAATGRPLPATFDVSALPLHLLLIQTWGFTDALAWNDPAWSISCELAAYLAFPLLVVAVDWRRVATPVLVAVLTLLFIALHLAMRGAPTLGYEITRFGLVRCLFEFGAGTIVCALWMRWHGHGPAAAIAALGIICGALWIAGVLPETLAIPAAFAAMLLVLALTDRGSVLGRRAIHYLGEISYATYLSHFMLFFAFKLAMPSPMLGIPAIAAYLALVLIASVGLYHLVERPAQRWLNGLGARRTGAAYG